MPKPVAGTLPPAYAPTSHTSPETAKVGGVAVKGVAPGVTYTTLNDQWSASFVFLPTATTSDGYPGAMLPFQAGSGTVT